MISGASYLSGKITHEGTGAEAFSYPYAGAGKSTNKI